MTVTVAGLGGLRDLVGRTLGPSSAIRVDQATIDAFANATDDHQWIHGDVERATREHGGTIAHGMLTLSLVVPMANSVFLVDEPVAINYGFDRVRFPRPLPAGSVVTATYTLAEVDAGLRGTKVRWDVAVSAGDVDAPVCVAAWWTFYPTLIEGGTRA